MSATVTKSKKKSTQKFIRLNLDEELEKMLQEFEAKYKLLSRSDVIRMLLSEIYWEKRREQINSKSFKEILSRAKFLDIEDEEEQFDFLRKNGLM